MKILISTIMRNAEDGMDKWYEQLNDLVKKCKQTWYFEIHLVVN